MREKEATAQTELVLSYVAEGARLTVVAEKAGGDGWYLWIENELGVSSVWIETFATGQAALDAGVKAIESEGVAAFIEIEGFEYLLDR